MEHPPLRELSLSEKKPPDLKESAHYRGSKQRYAEFRFGTVGSTLVTVVLDSVSAEQTDVYVDLNRNRVIEDNERLAGPGPKYRVPLSVEIPKGHETERFPRTVVFRLGRSGRSISYATAGYVEGTLRFQGRDVPIRRVDANGDGGMADPLDLLWVNWKRDGNWNPFTDRLPVTPIVQVENQRYVVRSDWLGQRLSLEKLEGSGETAIVAAEGKEQERFSGGQSRAGGPRWIDRQVGPGARQRGGARRRILPLRTVRGCEGPGRRRALGLFLWPRLRLGRHRCIPRIRGEGQGTRAGSSVRRFDAGREARQETTPIPSRRGHLRPAPARNGRSLDAPVLLSQREDGLVRAASRRGDPLDDLERENLDSATSGFS